MITSIIVYIISSFRTVEANCDCFRSAQEQSENKCQAFYSYLKCSKRDNITILSKIRSKNLKESSEASSKFYVDYSVCLCVRFPGALC